MTQVHKSHDQGVPYHLCDGPNCDESFHIIGWQNPDWFSISTGANGFDWCSKACHEQWLAGMRKKAEEPSSNKANISAVSVDPATVPSLPMVTPSRPGMPMRAKPPKMPMKAEKDSEGITTISITQQDGTVTTMGVKEGSIKFNYTDPDVDPDGPGWTDVPF